MRLRPTGPSEASAYTLVETMMAMLIAGLVLGGMILSFGALQKVFAGSEDYYRATSDQMRVLDFIAMDARRAVSGNVSNNGQTLTLILPDYLDETQNPPVPLTPTITIKGKLTYGTGGNVPNAVYSISGSAPNQVISRVYTAASGPAVTTALTLGGSDYQFTCTDPNNPGSVSNFSFGAAGQPTSITANITFMPKFTRLQQANARQATAVSTTVLLRNHL